MFRSQFSPAYATKLRVAAVAMLCTLTCGCAARPAGDTRGASTGAGITAVPGLGREPTAAHAQRRDASASPSDAPPAVRLTSAAAPATQLDSLPIRVSAGAIPGLTKTGMRIVLVAVTNLTSKPIAMGLPGPEDWVTVYSIEGTDHRAAVASNWVTDTPRDGDTVCPTPESVVIVAPGSTVSCPQRISENGVGPATRATLSVEVRLYDPELRCAPLRVIERSVTVVF
jgi:hypothetical protein